MDLKYTSRIKPNSSTAHPKMKLIYINLTPTVFTVFQKQSAVSIFLNACDILSNCLKKFNELKKYREVSTIEERKKNVIPGP